MELVVFAENGGCGDGGQNATYATAGRWCSLVPGYRRKLVDFFSRPAKSGSNSTFSVVAVSPQLITGIFASDLIGFAEDDARKDIRTWIYRREAQRPTPDGGQSVRFAF